MSIRRGKHQDNYSIIANEMSNDIRLSFEARGMLLYLLSKPEDWIVRPVDVCKQGGMGKDRYYRITQELVDAGYMVKDQPRGDDGRMLGLDLVVYDIPQKTADEPTTKTPLPENPIPVKPTHTKNLTSTKDLKNKTLFKSFWENYPHPTNKGGKLKAEAKFLKLDGASLLKALEGYKKYCSDEKQKSWYSPKMAVSWLNDEPERWVDYASPGGKVRTYVAPPLPPKSRTLQ